MKYLGDVKKIRDRSKIMMWMSQEDSIKKVFEKFYMHNVKLVYVKLSDNLKFIKTQ